MKRFYMVLLLLVAVLYIAACGASGTTDRSASARGIVVSKPGVGGAGTGAGIAHADVEEVGYPSRVRLWAEYVGTVTIVKWEWRVDDGSTNQWPLVWHDATADDGVFWLELNKPGTINAFLRGVDSNGNTCTSPIKIRSRNNYNAAPVVLFDEPLDYGEHEEKQADGTVLRYHEWRWDISRSYDPETSIKTIEWGIYGGADLDGDGIPDILYAGKNADGTVFSKLPGLIVEKIDDRYLLGLRVTPELTDDTLHVAVTATDTAAKEKKWGDGHVTLMK